MNRNFLPTEQEEKLIQLIQVSCRNEFVLIRLSPTMLNKSIIDASEGLRNLLLKNGIISFSEIAKTEKVLKTTILIAENKIIERTTSYYRPQSKNGDPRFCIYDLKKIASPDCLIYFTYFNHSLVAIPLVEGSFEGSINKLFKVKVDYTLIEELRLLISAIKDRGFIKSVSPEKFNPKDVGHTLEIALGLKLNSFRKADYKDQIEIKSKVEKSRTKDSLFSCVPNWVKSDTKSSANMFLKYGYISEKHPGFYDLYVTVGNKPNAQGLYLEPQNKIEQLHQNFKKGEDLISTTCVWDYALLRDTLNQKHPITVWIVAQKKDIGGEIYFWYKSLQLTMNPIFSQFISLIGLGIITYDWRGKVRPDSTGYRDHGHGFRISPKHRKLLFGETKTISL